MPKNYLLKLTPTGGRACSSSGSQTELSCLKAHDLITCQLLFPYAVSVFWSP